MINEQNEQSDHLASFIYETTFGWGLENYIGPNMVDLLHSILPNGHIDRNAFVNAFPTFPILSKDELQLWFLSNMKRSDQDPSEIQIAAQTRYNNDISLALAEAIGRLQLPGNAVHEVVAYLSGGRHLSALRSALARDLAFPVFGEALAEVSRSAHTALAGDTSARLS